LTAGRIIFLLEEKSMQTLLDAWLPRMFPGWQPQVHFVCVPHQGKRDLKKSIPIKLKAWRNPGDCFVIVCDSDGADCLALIPFCLKNVNNIVMRFEEDCHGETSQRERTP